eukprot:g20664.t1
MSISISPSLFSGPVVSPWRRRNFGEMVVPFFTVIAKIDAGTIKAIEWSDFCQSCDCIDHNCAVFESSCATNASSDGSDCDLKTYFAWHGTDSVGNYMTSSGKVISAFRQWSIGEIYGDTIKTIQDAPSKVPDLPSEIAKKIQEGANNGDNT